MSSHKLMLRKILMFDLMMQTDNQKRLAKIVSAGFNLFEVPNRPPMW